MGLLTLAVSFGTATAQEPAVKPSAPAGGAQVGNARPAAVAPTPPGLAQGRDAPVSRATDFSKRGVGLYLVLNENDSLEKYRPGLASLMRILNENGVPAKIFGDVGSAHETQIFGIVDGVTYGRVDYVDYDDGYRMNQLGEAAADLKRAYREAFPNGVPR